MAVLLLVSGCVTTEPDPTGIERCEHIVRKYVLYVESFESDKLLNDYLEEQGITRPNLRECLDKYPISSHLVEIRTILEAAHR